MQLFFVCVSVVSYGVFVLSFFVPYLLVPREGCASCLWYFIGTFIHIFLFTFFCIKPPFYIGYSKE